MEMFLTLNVNKHHFLSTFGKFTGKVKVTEANTVLVPETHIKSGEAKAANMSCSSRDSMAANDALTL